MTSNDSTAAVMTSGVDVYFRGQLDLDAVARLVASLAKRYEGRPGPDARTIEFHAEEGLATLRVRESNLLFAPVARELFGAGDVGAFRLEVEAAPSASLAREFAEKTLVYIAAELESGRSIVVADDNGTFYDPGEIAILAAKGSTRTASFDYQLNLGRAIAPEREETEEWWARPEREPQVLPLQAMPDAAGERGELFVLPSRSLPVVHGTRLALAALNDSRLNPEGKPVGAGIDPESNAVVEFLQRLNIKVLPGPAAIPEFLGAGVKTNDAMRLVDEVVLLFEHDANVDQVHTLVDAFCRDLLTTQAATGTAGLEAVSARFEREAALDGPRHLASLYDDAMSLDVYVVEAIQSLPVVRELVVRRLRYAPTLVAGPLVLALEIHAKSREGEDRADALSVALGSYLGELGVVAIDAAGDVFGPSELERLAAVRRGRNVSWTKRVRAALQAAVERPR